MTCSERLSAFCECHHARKIWIAWKPLLLRSSSKENSWQSLIFFVPSFLSPIDPSGGQIYGDKKIAPTGDNFIKATLLFNKPYPLMRLAVIKNESVPSFEANAILEIYFDRPQHHLFQCTHTGSSSFKLQLCYNLCNTVMMAGQSQVFMVHPSSKIQNCLS